MLCYIKQCPPQILFFNHPPLPPEVSPLIKSLNLRVNKIISCQGSRFLGKRIDLGEGREREAEALKRGNSGQKKEKESFNNPLKGTQLVNDKNSDLNLELPL